MKSYFKVKRLFDIVFSVILLIFLLPIFLVISVIIRFQDGGPSIFIQDRIGKNGVLFRFYKFRSMPLSTPNVESKDTIKLQITPFGKFIRRTNLDELPQFFNVLKGDMSFIGPRPPIPSQLDLIDLRKKNSAISLSPGLTGWAQVNSHDGMSVEQKAKFDGEYALRIGFLFDCFILLKTVLYFTKKPPVY
jgi:O-antigen biosynthesis protein WbqP